MSIYLVDTIEKYRCDTEEEATWLINYFKKSPQYTVKKSSNEIKTLKSKSEITDEWRRVVVTKEFNSEKEATQTIFPHYSDILEEDYDD